MSHLYIDIGGTKLRSELVLADKIIIEEVLSNSVELTDYIESKLSFDLNKVKISFAGQVNKGVIISSPNIKVKQKNISEYFLKNYSVEVKIDNDLNCALLFESNYFNENNIALLYIGTGIGSSAMDNGRIIRGHNNLSCEVGHIPFKKAPFKCGCGKFNCVENFTSGIALKKWFDYYDLSYKDLFELKISEQKEYKTIYDNFMQGVFIAFGTIVTLFNPKLLVLGGGIIKANSFILEEISANKYDFALKASCKDLDIQISEVDNAPIEGAKLL